MHHKFITVKDNSKSRKGKTGTVKPIVPNSRFAKTSFKLSNLNI
jgi:hypothetical protein